MNLFMGVSKFVRYGLVSMIGMAFLPLQYVVERVVLSLLDEKDRFLIRSKKE